MICSHLPEPQFHLPSSIFLLSPSHSNLLSMCHWQLDAENGSQTRDLSHFSFSISLTIKVSKVLSWVEWKNGSDWWNTAGTRLHSLLSIFSFFHHRFHLTQLHFVKWTLFLLEPSNSTHLNSFIDRMKKMQVGPSALSLCPVGNWATGIFLVQFCTPDNLL